MVVFADYMLKLELPYSDYWVPLLIGAGVALCALTFCKVVLGKKTPVLKRPSDVKQEAEFDPFTDGSPSELRKSYRRQGNPTEVFIAEPTKKDQPFRGWVIDRSIGGLGIQVAEDLA